MIGAPRSFLTTAAAIWTLFLFQSAAFAQAETDPSGNAQPAAAQPGSEPFDAAKEVRRQGNVEGAESQRRVDEISDATETLFSKYSNALRQLDSLRIYNHQMRDLIASQEAELASLTSQVDRVDVVGRSVTPLMLRMIDALDAFVTLDIPFLEAERAARIASLKETMARSDVTNAEKYRHIMEAYQIENEYGRTIEAYRSTLKREGREDKVDFLRFGRIALVYQTLDGTDSGVWDQEKRGWVALDSGYRTSIRDGIRIARKQAAPDLIRLPIPAAVEGGR
jgi:hypothetical protein